MLTQLTVNGSVYNALHLLALLQQAWPSQAKPDGDGSFKKPWVPKTAAQWFWSAKQIAAHTRIHKFEVPTTKYLKDVNPSTVYWFDIAGRLVSLAADSLYARDCGDVPEVAPKGAPKALNLEISYTGLYEKMLEDNNGQLNDKQAAADFREVLKGNKAAGKVGLRLLAAVMFLSEVARNTTAFHTGLMLLDLIEQGITIDTSTFKYDFKSTLWSPGSIDAILANRNKTKEEKMPAPDVTKETDAFASTGGEKLLAASMGMAPMSHVFSESGGAFNLEGGGVFAPPKPKKGEQPPKVVGVTNPLTGVRRKEATLLIRWLSYALKKAHPALEISVGDGEVQYDFKNAYSFTDAHLANSDQLADMKYILPLIDNRTKTFDCMIQA